MADDPKTPLPTIQVPKELDDWYDEDGDKIARPREADSEHGDGPDWLVAEAEDLETRDFLLHAARCYPINNRRIARLTALNKDLVEALDMMVADYVDYMTINNLGDPEKQHIIKVSRAALSKAKAQAEPGEGL